MFLNRRTEIPLTDADPVIYVRARDSDQSSVGLTLSTLYRIYRQGDRLIILRFGKALDPA